MRALKIKKKLIFNLRLAIDQDALFIIVHLFTYGYGHSSFNK